MSHHKTRDVLLKKTECKYSKSVFCSKCFTLKRGSQWAVCGNKAHVGIIAELIFCSNQNTGKHAAEADQPHIWRQTNIQLKKKKRKEECSVLCLSCDCYRDVTLSMPILRSSSVQALRTVVTSMLPLVQIFPEVFRRWRANSPSLSFSWCCWSEGCREQEQQSTTRSRHNCWIWRAEPGQAETKPADPIPVVPRAAELKLADAGPAGFRWPFSTTWMTE